MGTGPNFVLDKGFLAGGTTAYKAGEVVVMDTAPQSCLRSTSAAAPNNIGIVVDDIDAAKLTANPGKIYVNVRMLGIARGLSGAAFAKGARLTNDATGRLVTQATAGGPFFATALEATTGAGQYAEVLLSGPATI